jgi:hypothetical protein
LSEEKYGKAPGVQQILTQKHHRSAKCFVSEYTQICDVPFCDVGVATPFDHIESYAPQNHLIFNIMHRQSLYFSLSPLEGAESV